MWFMEDNTYINNPESTGELVRLDHQEQLVQKAVKLLPGCLADTKLTSVLDIGCGAGRWVLDMAFFSPDTEVAGIDCNKTLVDYANARARSQRLTNASFGLADALDPHGLPFDPASFDLIHLRFAAGWLLPDAWEELLKRCYELLREGGYMVIAEGEGMYTSSPALNKLYALLCLAMYETKRSPSNNPTFMGVAARLGYLLTTLGYKEVRGEAGMLDYSFYHPEANTQWRDSFRLLVHETAPFLLSAKVATAGELAEVSREIDIQMFQADFYGIGSLFTFYGQK